MITIFENFNEPKFKEGDFVYFINTFDTMDYISPKVVSKTTPYKIENVVKNYFKFGMHGIRLEEFPRTMWDESKFMSELEYTSKKYNL